MDAAKSDDSAGSDSLDKSLQKKCVVDDVGQGEGSFKEIDRKDRQPQQKSDIDGENHRASAICSSHNSQSHITKKTDQNSGDELNADGDHNVGMPVANNYQNDDGRLIDDLEIVGNHTSTQVAAAEVMGSYELTNSGNISNNQADDTIFTDAQQSSQDLCHTKDFNAIIISQPHEDCSVPSQQNEHINLGRDSMETPANSSKLLSDSSVAPSKRTTSTNSDNSNISPNISCNNSGSKNNAFESKVKQISKNLKETTLAEGEGTRNNSIAEHSTSRSTSASYSSTPECEQTMATIDDEAATVALYSLGPSTSAAAAAAAAAAASAISAPSTSVQDELDHRSKKVRFHPDVKENDGGNRVIPKKKKKLKTIQIGGSTSGVGSGGFGEASGSSQRGQHSEDDMELDDEEELDVEEEAVFSIAKTIEYAQDYLKEHPLTFAGSFDKSNITTQSGLLEEEDLPQLLSETVSEEDDDIDDVQTEVVQENGVACILGKQIKCGKVEFLLRYVDRPGLYWESEEFITQRCPNLLHQYEQSRERRQARLMNFVAKRQNLRQRYTDF